MNVSSTPSDTVIARIRKLMALTADRGASENEAQLASEHVQRLLAEHNLSMSAIEMSGGSSGEGGKRTREDVSHRQVYKWQRSLMAAIASLNYCKSLERFKSTFKGSVFDGYDLIGRVDNVASCRAMFEYLLQTIERLARDEVNNDPTQYFTRAAHSFKQGCADRLVDRLKDKRDQMIAEQEAKAKDDAVRARHPGAAKSNLPAVILSDVIQDENDLNNDLYRGWEPGTTKQRRIAAENRERAEEQARSDKYAQALRDGFSADEAHYISWGYSPERARELARPTPIKPEKPETDAQRYKREAREQRENDRYWQRVHRERSKIDRTAYRRGAEAGDSVSLNRQVSDNAGRGKLS